jgi:hypothetical protein
MSQKSGAVSLYPPIQGQYGLQPLISTGIESGSKAKLNSWANRIAGAKIMIVNRFFITIKFTEFSGNMQKGRD